MRDDDDDATRSDEWFALDNVPAALRDYVDLAVGGKTIAVRWDGGTLFAHRSYEADVTVSRLGSGGGFCWQREWTRRRFAQYLDRLNDTMTLHVKRGDREDVLPGALE